MLHARSSALLLGASLLATTLAATATLAQAPAGTGASPGLPAPDLAHEAQNYSQVTMWPEGAAPRAPDGFDVKAFARGLDSPRGLLALPNGDILVAEATTKAKPPAEQDEKAKGQVQSGSAGVSANRITLLRDADQDGVAETRHVILTGLNQPFGLAFAGDHLYVANTDGVVRYPYKPGDTTVTGEGRKIVELPAGGYNNHWTRNLLLSRDAAKLYISVGSASNIGEFGLDNEVRRAAILEVNLDGSGERILASGLRNPVGMDIQPESGVLWTAVNERDGIGDDLVPDYITGVKDGGFYGWPYSYFGQNPDPRLKGQRPDLIAQAIVPDYAVGSHTASLGLAFYDQAAFPAAYRGGAFVAQRGSWNRSSFSGYKVIFVPFKDGKPSGPPQDFLTGFMVDPGTGKAHGRPVSTLVDGRGGLLVSDDAGDTIWSVRHRS
ncbi:PQQ-dependent sugar dehydrogenase [Microvirga pudoricolor]|uniref:PQQ-dependent sugar dehydrogenase n=1 Tax=Microvirga pudoricolor TaxID=2778729 RepID=UPI00195117C0|nr:sorbosone dehydrogenase family protein [Microvirga pudoricolor]MBM6594938.1 sorbosone dehydrogenase family protein [Microvirga pudoricolor]